MKKLLFLLLTITLMGAGCSTNLTSKLPNKIQTDINTPQQIENKDFCLKQKEDAEKLINKFQLTKEMENAYNVWIKVFIKYNNIDEKYFKEHIFLTAFQARKDGDYMWYSADYYFKLGDIYLKAGGSLNDGLSVNLSHLENFNKEKIENLLNIEGAAVTSTFNEPHPNFGKVPNKSRYNYPWGQVRINNIAEQSKTLLTCEEAVSLLKTCHEDITPVGVIYRQTLGKAWLEGKYGKYAAFSKEKNCGMATIDLFRKKLDNCFTGESCNNVIN